MLSPVFCRVYNSSHLKRLGDKHSREHSSEDARTSFHTLITMAAEHSQREVFSSSHYCHSSPVVLHPSKPDPTSIRMDFNEWNELEGGYSPALTKSDSHLEQPQSPITEIAITTNGQTITAAD
ncbi:hypothetical protein CLAFUW4_11102 [Fulvia fulva]|uniref:Uncharacterized protein n=1 Tax=Passalora fulva TaxID=5499 RepID=A0A9Q8PCK4_PASFU|nr:uncharacterized protein CLAFUR5_10145 [Fulvia fulva]KAK4620011.1 hypothetical protein CLAFUR4_11107 [Fulvia fulva]KAK4621175.1 hypothetical protein CLAFUR0_11113 [Fulvia fulva]UJO19951.1 hypothetical protein CLAFUR5_10145 [Fulvia fulva]WPV17585.1 hypothetical protein CLAFUW4_11102 [Fulvia fulva]WPV32182.1 hypothetical protein CLAFUW7_11098 [Fulvia fulva]